MASDERLRTEEVREAADMIIVSANPDGVVEAAEGTFAWDSILNHMFINIDGVTAWRATYVGAFGEIWVEGSAAPTVIGAAGEANRVQVTQFTNAGQSLNTTPSAATDDITIIDTGIYLVVVTLGVDSVPGPGADFGWKVYTNNGTVAYNNLHNHRSLAGGGGEMGAVPISGLASLTAGDTVELWVWNFTGNENIINSDVNLTVVKLF